MHEKFLVVTHADLTAEQVDELRALFDSEYFAKYGPWDPDRPYGYSPADVHTLAYHDSVLVGHVGYQHRTIAVGRAKIMIAGTGGVLVSEHARGGGLGSRVMARVQQVIVDDERVDLGYLGCREEVVPFYESAGWQRIEVTERHLSMRDPREVVVSTGGPILIFPTHKSDWPAGDIDLHGTPW
jgi:aminoglycoside 2'-N-acetyltransferase I